MVMISDVIIFRGLCIYVVRLVHLFLFRIICENLTVLIKKYPEVVLRQQTELMEFLASTNNIVQREDFFCVLVSGFFQLSRYNFVFIRQKIMHMRMQIFEQQHLKLCLTLLHSERPKLHTILAFLSAIGLNCHMIKTH